MERRAVQGNSREVKCIERANEQITEKKNRHEDQGDLDNQDATWTDVAGVTYLQGGTAGSELDKADNKYTNCPPSAFVAGEPYRSERLQTVCHSRCGSPYQGAKNRWKKDKK